MQLQRQSTRGLASSRQAQVASRAAPRPAGRSSRQISKQNVVLRASSLDSVSLFADASLVGSTASTSQAAKADTVSLENLPLTSELGVDFTKLRDHLAAGQWREAEDEHRAVLIRMAGPEAERRGWVYFTEVKAMPNTDLQTLDKLWTTASKGRFGFSVQKEIWMQNNKRWPKFFKQIDWVVGENNVYRKWPAEFNYSLDAPKGHLPLTNALRGTQLFQAIMEHPAFEKKATKSIDERSAALGSKPLF